MDQATKSGLFESLSLSGSTAPSTYEWSLDYGPGVSGQLTPSGAVEIDSGHTPIATLGAPSVEDESGNETSANWTMSPDGSTLSLQIDPNWLADPARVFPITIDPTVTWNGPSQACTLKAANPSTTYCNTSDLGVGANSGNAQRSILYFPNFTNGHFPVDAVLQEADLSLPVDTLTGSVNVNAYPLTRTFTSSATWNTYDGSHTWTSTGGDYSTTPTVSTSAPSAGHTMTLPLPTSMVQSWINGAAGSDGIELKASSESGTNLVKFLPPSLVDDAIIAYWSVSGGIDPNTQTYTHTLDDHLQLAINAANGNLVLDATDLTIDGVGLDENVDRYYNSFDQGTYDNLGMGWTSGEGSDVRAEVNADNVTIWMPGENPETFLDNGSSYIAPSGFDATLSFDPLLGSYLLTFTNTGEVWHFNPQSYCGDFPLTSDVDMNGGTITYNYSSSTCTVLGRSELTSITDTEGRTTTISNSTFETHVTDPSTPTARTISYNYGGYTGSQLLSVIDASGNTTLYGYDASDSYLTSITDPDGHITTISYDSDHHVSSVTYVTNTVTMTGATYSFSYDPGTQASPDSGYTVMTDPNGHTSTFYYDHLDRRTGFTNADGNSQSMGYDPTTGNVGSYVNGLGKTASYNYMAARLPIEVEQPTGAGSSTANTYYNYNSSYSGQTVFPSSVDQPNGDCTAYKYDANGNVIQTDPGLTPPVGTTECDGGGPGSTSSDETTSGYQGDPGVSCGGITAELCWTHDARGDATNYTYYSDGDLKTVTPPSALSISTTGSLATNAGAGVTTLSVSPQHVGDAFVLGIKLNSSTVSASSISGGGATWTRLKKSADSAQGRTVELWLGSISTTGASTITVTFSGSVSSTAVEFTAQEYTNGGGSSTAWSEDVAGQSQNDTSSTAVNFPSLAPNTSSGELYVGFARPQNTASAGSSPGFTYDLTPTVGDIYTFNPDVVTSVSPSTPQAPAGQSVAVGALLTATGGSIGATSYTYDSVSRIKTMTDGNGNVTTYNYDAMDRVTKSLSNGAITCISGSGNCVSKTYDADGNLLSTTDAGGNTTTNSYNALNQLASVTDPLGHVTSYTYDGIGNLLSKTDPDGNVTTYTYDPANQQLTVTDGLTLTASFTYDAGGNRLSYTNGAGDVTSYTYDNAGNLSSVAQPGGSCGLTPALCETNTYNGEGQVLTDTNPDGKVATSSYDSFGRLQQTTYSDGSPTLQYTYDVNGNVATMSTGSVTTDYSYDAINSLVEAENMATSAIVRYGHDSNNNVTSITYPNGQAVSRAFNGLNQLASVTDWNSHTTSFTYTGGGSLAGITYPNGIVTSESYNAAGQITSITDDHGLTPIASFSYGRDNAGLVASETDSGTPGTASASYSYDSQQQLTAAGSSNYSYDGANNLTLGPNGDNQKFNADSELCWQGSGTSSSCTAPSGATSFSYSNEGNRTSMTPAGGSASNYGWNQLNQMVSFTPTSGSSSTYTYDDKGLLTGEAVGSTTENYVWDTQEEFSQLLQDGTNYYVYGPEGTPIEQVNASSGLTRYLLSDQLGSVRGITNSAGTLTGAQTFDSWGNVTATTGSITTPFGYAGSYRDAVSGLDYLRARWYDPSTGQFMSIDPVEFQTQRPYQYAFNNPTTNTDPTGLCGTWCITFGYVVYIYFSKEALEFGVSRGFTTFEWVLGIACGVLGLFGPLLAIIGFGCDTIIGTISWIAGILAPPALARNGGVVEKFSYYTFRFAGSLYVGSWS